MKYWTLSVNNNNDLIDEMRYSYFACDEYVFFFIFV